MKMQTVKAGVIALTLMASSAVQAQSSVLPPPTLSTGRTFHCILVADLSRSSDAGFGSCRLTRPVLADDGKTVAIAPGSWLNGSFDGNDTVLWKAVQTGENAGALIYARPDAMVSTVKGGVGHAGDDLLVTVQRDVAFPKPESNGD